MKEILNKLKTGVVIGIGFSLTTLIIGLTYASVTSGTTLTSSMWNNLVSRLDVLTDNSGNITLSGALQLDNLVNAPFVCDGSVGGYMYFDTQITGSYQLPCVCVYNQATGLWNWSPTDNWGVTCD